MRVLIFVSTVALALLISSCSRQGDRKPELRPADNVSGRDAILAVVGGESITIGDFEAEMNRRARSSGIHYATESQKRALLDEMIEFKVLLQRARAAGYDHNPEVLTKLDQLIVGKFREDHLATNDLSALTISEDEARTFYQLNQERFTFPESVRVAIIYFKSSPRASIQKRAEVKERAESVLARARQADAAEFSDLARKHSEDQASRYAGGDIGWLTRGDTIHSQGSDFEQAAFEIAKVGQIAPLVETPEGFYIVRLVQKKPAGVRPFEEVKNAIAYQVAREHQSRRRNEFLEEMRKGLEIKSNPSLLRSISITERLSDHAPPPLPNG